MKVRGAGPRRRRAELLHDAGAEVAEGPRWDPRVDRLLWVDILAGEIHLLEPETGDDRIMGIGRHVGAALPRSRGGYAVAAREGFVGLADDGTEELLQLLFDDGTCRLNDARCDGAGRMWGTSLTYDMTPGTAALYCMDTERTVIEVVGGLWLGNGIDWSPDDAAMYLVDTYSHGIDRLGFDLMTGEVRDRRRLVEIPERLGNPDGLTVDAEGCIWVAVYGGGCVHRYTPEGTLDTVVEVPGVSNVTSPGFGGSKMDRLFVTTARENLGDEQRRRQPHAGAIFALDPGVSGQPTHMYGG
jgi:sugar lactone lactonase YvrE